MQGKTINGFTLQRLLGTGGMAEVWYAENKIGKKAAVKMLSPKLCQDENVTSRFYTEAKVMVELDHPNIRQVYDYGEIDGRPAIVMEYLEGDDLKTKMKRGQHFTDEELKHWWNQLVDALNYTHQKGIVHRDIKPGNIFVDRKGNIKLLDFGIAKVRESIGRTQTGQKLGTLMYMSPEQVLDSKHVDYRTDIYSLAVTFIHLITGKRPYDSDTSSDFEISEQIVYKPLDLSGVPDGWRNFLAPYLEKDPLRRSALRPIVETNGVDDEGTVVGDAPKKKELKNKPTPEKEPKTTDNNKVPSKKALWIGLGIAAAVVALLVLLLKPKQEPAPIDPDTQAYKACQTVADYNNNETLLFARKRNNKTGYVDQKGSYVIPPVFDMGYGFVDGVAAVVVNNKVGFIDSTGSYIIEPRSEYNDYFFYYGFSEGLAPIRMNDKWGYINKMGDWAISPKFDDAWIFEKGLARVCVEDKWGYIDRNGDYVCTPKYQYVGKFSEGLAVVSNEDFKYGYINTKGKLVIDLVFENASDFSDGLATVEVNGKYGYIDKKGDIVIGCRFENASDFSEGLAMVENKHLMRGYIDKTGEYVIRPQFYWAKDFKEGLAAVEIDEKWGFADKKGELVIKAQFDDVDESFVEGLAAVKVGEKWGFINKTGKFVVKPQFDSAYSFYHGTASVKNGEKWGLLFRNGTIIMDE